MRSRTAPWVRLQPSRARRSSTWDLLCPSSFSDLRASSVLILFFSLVSCALGSCTSDDSSQLEPGHCGKLKSYYRLSSLTVDFPGHYDANIDGDSDGSPDNAFSLAVMSFDLAARAFELKERFSRSVTEGETGLLFRLGYDGFNDSCAELQIFTASPTSSELEPSGTPVKPFEPNVGLPIATLRGRVVNHKLIFPLPGEPGYDANAAQELVLNIHLNATVMSLPIQGVHISGTVDEGGILDGQIHGALTQTSLVEHLAKVFASEATKYIRDNPNSQGAQRVIGFLERPEVPTHPSAKKCANPAACCHSNPTTCTIIPEELIVNSQFKAMTAADIKMFDAQGHIAPTPNATPELRDAISLGLGFTARQGTFEIPCNLASGWCRVASLPDDLQVTMRAIWAGARNDVWVVGEDGLILHYDGHRWSKHDLSNRTTLRGVWGFAQTRDIFVVGDNGSILHSQGGSFTESPTASRQPLRAIWGLSPLDMWAAGESATILHYDGMAWKEVQAPAAVQGQRLDSITGTSASDVWISGTTSTLLHYNGSTWSVGTDLPVAKLRSIWIPRTPDFQLWSATSSRVVYRFDGMSWSVFAKGRGGTPVPFDADLTTIYGESPTNLWVAGDELTLLHFDGQRFKPQTQLNLWEHVSRQQQAFSGVFMIQGTDTWVVGTSGLVLHCTQRNRPDACIPG